MPQVVRRLGVTRQVAYRWRQAWEAGGAAALASKGSAGPKARLTPGQIEQITDALLKGPVAQGYKTQLWTLPRVAALIESQTGIRYHPGHVWRILGSLGFSCQRPERRALERDEEAIGQWRRRTWPALKKSAARRPLDCLCRRKRLEHTAHPRAHLGSARPDAIASGNLLRI